MTEGTLEQEVSSRTRPGTALFEVDVRDSSPEIAASLANDVANALVQQEIATFNQENAAAQTQVQQELTAAHGQITTTINQLNGLSGNNQARAAVFQAQLEVQQQQYADWQTRLADLNLVRSQSRTILL
jgi:uncharacterized protein involved in exopolysaccharide biosynthesis